MPKKKPEPNPIETAIGNRAKPTKDIPKIVDGKEFQKVMEPGPIPTPAPEQIPDEPSPQEMMTLEELNRQTEERLQDQYPEEPSPAVKTKILETQIPYIPPIILVSKPDPQPATKNCSPESPPQKIEKKIPYDYDPPYQEGDTSPQKIDKEFHPVGKPIPGMDKLPPDFKVKHTYETGIAGAKPTGKELTVAAAQEQAKLLKADFIKTLKETPAEDIEFTNLKKYILEDGFVLATVAFHIVSLCAEPLMTPSTTMWDFVDRASIPDMVLALLNQPGYLEGIWPSLKIVMGSNVGNSAWSAGIATTLAFFDVIRTLPALKELQNGTV